MQRPASPEVLDQTAALPASGTQSAALPAIRSRRLATPALLALLVGGLLRLALAWRNLDALDTYFFPDDTYLSLGIARNLALGFGSTFDRHIPTNGYQPLYVWLMAPIYWLFPNDLALPIHLALTLLALAGALTGWLIYRVVDRLATPRHATLACAIWMFDPLVVAHSLNGLETGLALLGIAATTGWYLARIRSRDNTPARDVLILGLLAGLTILTRVDQGILLAAIGLDWLLDRRDRRTLARLALAGLVALAINTPWLALSWSIGAGPLPESGAAVRFNALAQAGGRPGWYLSALVLALSVLFTAPRSTSVLLCAGVLALLLRRGQRGQMLRATGQRLRPLRFAAFYSAALLLAYWLYIPAYWFFDRYLHPIALFALIAGVMLLPDLPTLAPRARRGAGAAILAFVLIEAALSARFLVVQPTPDGYVTIAHWVNANLAGQTVGMFQSGAAGYWADNVTIVNLDGVIDRSTLAARRAGRLGDELRRRGIDWVIDWETTAGLPVDGELRLEAPREIPGVQTWGSRWYLFKVK